MGDRYLTPHGLRIVTPHRANALAQAWRHQGIVPDFRPPNNPEDSRPERFLANR